MVKYDRLKEPLRKAKQSAMLTEDIERANKRRLEDAYKEKKRMDARDEELFHFGMDLYENGYVLDDFIQSINTCIESNYKTTQEIANTGWFIYDNISHVPSWEKLTKIVNNPNLIEAVKNGYNVAYRRNLAKELEKKNGIVR